MRIHGDAARLAGGHPRAASDEGELGMEAMMPTCAARAMIAGCCSLEMRFWEQEHRQRRNGGAEEGQGKKKFESLGGLPHSAINQKQLCHLWNCSFVWRPMRTLHRGRKDSGVANRDQRDSLVLRGSGHSPQVNNS